MFTLVLGMWALTPLALELKIWSAVTASIITQNAPSHTGDGAQYKMGCRGQGTANGTLDTSAYTDYTTWPSIAPGPQVQLRAYETRLYG